MHSKAIRKNESTLDLNKVRQTIFEDISKLLDSFGLEYYQDADNIFMRCPIHEGSDNPNGLSISLDKQVWRCWTRGCHEHYSCNIWGFIKGCLGTDSFSEALKHVCEIYNVTDSVKEKKNVECNIDSDDPYDVAGFGKIVSRLKKHKSKIGCSNCCMDAESANVETIPSVYFRSRGFDDATLQWFGVRDAATNTGPFRNRAIIPIRMQHHDIGYIARATKEWVKPKYIFSEGFKKSEHLYNYDYAIESMARSTVDTLFVVEGQGDVWRLWECGVKNAVGLFGKDISSVQRKLLLASGATTLVILTDNDQVGRESKIKIKRDLGRLFKLVFPKMYTKDLGNMLNETVKESILKHLQGYY